jgi:lipoprotein Spr
MKNLMLIVVFTCTFTAITNYSFAQPSLKFIDGIELNPEPVYYASSGGSMETGGSASSRKNTVTIPAGLKMATEACKSLQFKYAQLLDTEIEAVSNYSLFQFIDEWWSTRYSYGGSTKKGIDCSALTGLLLSSVYAIALPRTAREQYSASKKIGREDLVEGDLVFFNTRGGVSHVGVYLCNDYFVHASVANGVTISSLNDTYYANKYIGAGRALPSTAGR